MAENTIKDVKLKIGTETQFQSKLKDLPLNTLVGTTDPIQEGELDTSIITKLEKADNALPKPTNDTTGSAGQVLKKTANGSEWGDVAGGTNVVANPTAAGTDTLTKLTVGDTTYNIPSGGGGGPTYSAGTHITIDSNNAINAEWPTAANTGYEGIGSTGTVTGVKMNGEVKGTSGVVDLGSVQSALTTTQLQAVNSGITASKVQIYDDYNSEILTKYVKPATGIPKSDLASAVQTSLIKADSAVQPGSLAIKTAVLDGTTLTLTI